MDDSVILAKLEAVQAGQTRVERSVEKLESSVEKKMERQDEVIEKAVARVGTLEGTVQNWTGRATILFALVIMFFGGLVTFFWSQLPRAGG